MKNKPRMLLGVLLILTLVLGLLPGTVLTARAAVVSHTVTFKVVNGSWGDGTREDKTIVLTGYEGDELRLETTDIPRVTKPDEGYEFGSGAWTPEEPPINLAGMTFGDPITEDTTYTYTYGPKGQISVTVTLKVVHGTWDDGTREDKTIVLTGLEGDELRLTLDDMPGVTKPDEGYRFSTGVWTPDEPPINFNGMGMGDPITEDTTFTFTYGPKTAVSHTVTFKVVNGSWDDGTAADKTVTLTGYEDETLKLAADQIPSVGSKPNEDYEIGNWDNEPSTESIISEDVTYIYTYAAKDYSAAYTARDMISSLPAAADVTLENKGAIEAAHAAYNALTDDQKAKVGEETLRKLTDAETALNAIQGMGKVYFISLAEGQNHEKNSGLSARFTIKRSYADENTHSRFQGVQTDGKDVDQRNYDAAEGSVKITLKPAYLDSLSVGSHTLKVLFSDGTVEIPFSIIAHTTDPDEPGYDFRFTYTVQWQGGKEDSIDWTLYNPDGSVAHKKFNKKTVSETEWRYEAWLASGADYYIVENVPEGYKVLYQNVGAHADVTDRCYNGGTIINYKVPKTGDEANLALWLGMVLTGASALCYAALTSKRRKEER